MKDLETDPLPGLIAILVGVAPVLLARMWTQFRSARATRRADKER